jgi:hypothetical protein
MVDNFFHHLKTQLLSIMDGKADLFFSPIAAIVP